MRLTIKRATERRSDEATKARRAAWMVVAPLLLLGVVACQEVRPTATGPATQMGSDPLMQATLAELAKGNSDKAQLGWYASSMLRQLDPPVKQFAKDMNASQGALHDRLKKWAQKNHVDLKVRYNSADPRDVARQAMEKQQGDALQADSNVDFQRDMLILMYLDYQNQGSLVRSLLTRTADPELKGYLEESLRVHTEGIKTITGLLARYKWQ